MAALVGIPLPSGSLAAWGEQLPSWHNVQAAVQRTCACRHRNEVQPWLCYNCCGLISRSSVPHKANPEAGLCRWCGLRSDQHCAACFRGVHHFLGQCQRWMLGANRLYAPDADQERWICPDCTWIVISAVGSRIDRRAPNEAVNAVHEHMQAMASEVTAGAGQSHKRRTQELPRVRRVRAWILNYLDNRRWISWVSLAKAAQEVVAPPHGPTNRGPLVRRVLTTAARALEREEKLWMSDTFRARLSLRLRRGETSPPACAQHSRHGRRRRPRNDGAPHASRRRTLPPTTSDA